MKGRGQQIVGIAALLMAVLIGTAVFYDANKKGADKREKEKEEDRGQRIGKVIIEPPPKPKTKSITRCSSF